MSGQVIKIKLRHLALCQPHGIGLKGYVLGFNARHRESQLIIALVRAMSFCSNWNRVWSCFALVRLMVQVLIELQ